MSLATSMTPGTTGWIVTLDCGHTRHLEHQPNGAVRCDTCEPHGTEIRTVRLPGSPLWPGEIVPESAPEELPEVDDRDIGWGLTSSKGPLAVGYTPAPSTGNVHDVLRGLEDMHREDPHPDKVLREQISDWENSRGSR